MSIFKNKPLVVQTLERLDGYFSNDEQVVIIPRELESITAKYVGLKNFIIEPMRRNTAAAICLVAMNLQKKHHDAVLHVMPADHLISPKHNFLAALRFGQELAEKDYLVTYGIKPTRPETGYGYVKISKRIFGRGKIAAFDAEGFTEKPSRTKAQEYLKSKRHLWNSGIFSFRISRILGECRKFIPEVYNGVGKFLATKRIDYFRRIPDVSIDYGVMEKSAKLCLVRGNFLWDDVG